MKKVTIYSGEPCPYCSAAKALLKTKNIEIEEFDIWKDPSKAKEMLQRTNGARTIPQEKSRRHHRVRSHRVLNQPEQTGRRTLARGHLCDRHAMHKY